MGYQHKTPANFWSSRLWSALLTGLAIVVASQIVQGHPVQAQTGLDPNRSTDYYSITRCTTYDHPNQTPGGNPSTLRLHRCLISQIDDPAYRHQVCISLHQLESGATTGHENRGGDRAYYYYERALSLLDRTVLGARPVVSNLADPPAESLDCQRPRGSNAVHPNYADNGVEISCQRSDRVFTGAGLDDLLNPNPDLGAAGCQIEARFEWPTVAFSEPPGYDLAPGWGPLSGCGEASAGDLAVWTCQAAISRSAQGVCLQRDSSQYAGFDRNSYHLPVKFVTFFNNDCYEFADPGRYKTYIRCTNLVGRAEVEPKDALAAGKCRLVIFLESAEVPETAERPADSDPPACDDPEDCPTFEDTIQCTDDCGFLDTVNSILSWMAYLVVPIVTLVIIVAGVQLSLAGDNPEATKKAKMRITQAIVALVCYILLWSVLRWLI